MTWHTIWNCFKITQERKEIKGAWHFLVTPEGE
jgi:hypothetical protein